MRMLKKTMKYIGFAALFLIIIYGGIYIYAKMTPKLDVNSANKFYLYDKDGINYSGKNSNWVSLDKISNHLIDATISIEDKKFYKHQGFDIMRIVKSLYVNIINGQRLQGASTITQQYAKNLFLDFGKTWERKIEEAFLTVRLEMHYSKEEILEGYLNTINYGGIFGIENASLYYFNKHAKDLTIAEASILAGIPKNPTKYSPTLNEKDSKNRQELILEAMLKNKKITEKEKNDALKTELVFYGKKDNNGLKMLMYYEDAVIKELKNIRSIPSSFLNTGGLKIYTNLDMEAQTILETKINEEEVEEKTQIASIMMDPNNGKIIALTGGRDYSKSQYNRAISSKRQVGSTLKPFLYYSALENGFTASTTFTSEKTTFVFGENKTYSPGNFSDKYPDKPISMAAALSYSDNIYAVKTHLFLGEETLVDVAKRVGIPEKLSPIPSLALGSEGIPLIDMMQGYATLANEGYKIKPYFITRVEDMDGNVLYKAKEEKESVLNKSIVYILNELLTTTYASEFIDYNYPTCMSIASRLTNKYAIKTGTTDSDHLAFGYNKDVLIGIWAGYDDNSYSNINIGTRTKNIWANVIEAYLKDKETHWYDIPKNVVGVLIDPISGKPASESSTKKKMLYFIKGTEPYEDDIILDSIIPTIKEDS